jgi:hypothetical protein
MPVMSKPSPAARISLIYITLGALMLVWSGIWFVYLKNSESVRAFTWYFCAGFMLTGLTFLIIGMALGRIGRAARHAELPPPEVTAVEAQATQNAAARAPMVAPINPAVPGAVPGNVVTPGQAGAPPATPAAPPVRSNQANTSPPQV